jgi:hypothetical protein
MDLLLPINGKRIVAVTLQQAFTRWPAELSRGLSALACASARCAIHTHDLDLCVQNLSQLRAKFSSRGFRLPRRSALRRPLPLVDSPRPPGRPAAPRQAGRPREARRQPEPLRGALALTQLELD